jgi:hypothetical protein
MKIQKFNEAGIMNNSNFPIKCRFKNRVPDPGICYVTEIDFKDRKIHWRNYNVSSIADFDDVEFLPDLFFLNIDKYNI